MQVGDRALVRPLRRDEPVGEVFADHDMESVLGERPSDWGCPTARSGGGPEPASGNRRTLRCRGQGALGSGSSGIVEGAQSAVRTAARRDRRRRSRRDRGRDGGDVERNDLPGLRLRGTRVGNEERSRGSRRSREGSGSAAAQAPQARTGTGAEEPAPIRATRPRVSSRLRARRAAATPLRSAGRLRRRLQPTFGGVNENLSKASPDGGVPELTSICGRVAIVIPAGLRALERLAVSAAIREKAFAGTDSLPPAPRLPALRPLGVCRPNNIRATSRIRWASRP